MTRDQRRRRSGAPPRARRRGRVPSLPLERASPGALLGYRRCHEYSGPQPLCASHRTRFRPWCGRQMDRRREPERAWRSLGSDPPQPQPARSRRSDGRSAPLSRPAASPDPIAAESGSYATSSERLFRSGAPPVSVLAAPFPARRPKPICAPVASPDGSTGPPCAITRRSTTARRTTLRSKFGRRCLLPSPISTAISPASSAPGSIHGGPTRRRLPIRAAPLAICSATVCASATACPRSGHRRRRRRRRNHARA